MQGRRGIEVAALTSARNKGCVEALGCQPRTTACDEFAAHAGRIGPQLGHVVLLA